MNAKTYQSIKPEVLGQLQDRVSRHSYPTLFATISGAHLYGFPSPDSDFDLRGAHMLPLEDVVGLDKGEETVESSTIENGLEIDLVTHDVAKFFELMTRKNGYVLEQLFSPLVVQTSPEHDELKEIGRQCVTRHHSHHYVGFAETQWKLFAKESPRRVKPLLYVCRVLLTGIHLMNIGEVEANLENLNQVARLGHVDELIARKRSGPEQSTLDDASFAFHEREYERLRVELELSHKRSNLAETSSARPALNDLLIRLRIRG